MKFVFIAIFFISSCWNSVGRIGSHHVAGIIVVSPRKSLIWNFLISASCVSAGLCSVEKVSRYKQHMKSSRVVSLGFSVPVFVRLQIWTVWEVVDASSVTQGFVGIKSASYLEISRCWISFLDRKSGKQSEWPWLMKYKLSP